MCRFFLVLAILLAGASVFSQSRFMAGVSVNPNLTVQPIYSLDGSKPSLGAGANFGMYLGKKWFLLTGFEAQEMSHFMKGTYLGYAPNSPYYYPNVTYNFKSTTTMHGWDIPLLANYMLTNKNKKVSFFLTAGLSYGRTTYLRSYGYDSGGNPTNSSYTFSGNELRRPYGMGIILGFGCKVNLNEKYSLILIPDYTDKDLKRLELRTMLVYNFGKMKK